MNKKYTVFLSSTYDDLREERREVIQSLLELNCIPCGMENFPADDDEQFEFIKSVIDECDYFVLIIAGRYGSITKNGKSFTEMEYRYAVQKGIPVLAFIHNNIGTVSFEKSEKDEKSRKKLDAFIEYVSNGKMVKFWNGKEDLAGKVSRTMVSAINLHPAKGWIRGDSSMSIIPGTFAGESLEVSRNHLYVLDEMYKKAIYYKERNEFEKSRMFFECCLILNPKKVNVLREYGGLYYDNGGFDEALHFWEKLIDVQKSCENYYLCALAYYCLNNYTKSKEFFRLALECPDDGFYNSVQNFLKDHNI